MSKYEWDINHINSLEDDKLKSLLLDEINNAKSQFIKDYYYNSGSLKKIRNAFRSDFILLSKICPELLEFNLEFYKKYNIQDFGIFNLPEHQLSDENLLYSIEEFYKYLDDKEMLEIVKRILDPNSHLLKIEEKNDVLGGRVIKAHDGINSYGILYRKHTEDDEFTLAHETGHMISDILFNGNINNIMKNFLIEVESIYTELLYIYYVGLTRDSKKLFNVEGIDSTYLLKISLLARNNLLVKELKNALEMYIQKEYQGFPIAPGLFINDTLKKQKINYPITKESMDQINETRLYIRSLRLNSYLTALELFYKTVEDKEKGLHTYKKLMTSTSNDYINLLNRYGLNYLQNDETYTKMIEDGKNIKKLILGDSDAN